MNRGSSTAPPRLPCTAPCFNEAPIHESGKWRGELPGAPRSRSFNEAPIHESGKLQKIMTAIGAFDASMRPRFMNRGSMIDTLPKDKLEK